MLLLGGKCSLPMLLLDGECSFKHGFSLIPMKIINEAFFYLFFGNGDPRIDL